MSFVGCLERLGVRYLVGGSVASAIHGEPRATNDVDLSVDLKSEHVAPLIHALGHGYYVRSCLAIQTVQSDLCAPLMKSFATEDTEITEMKERVED
ncbi:MAG: hypothetical protein ACYS22_07995, partial [Planctomycetota bacterium]